MAWRIILTFQLKKRVVRNTGGVGLLMNLDTGSDELELNHGASVLTVLSSSIFCRSAMQSHWDVLWSLYVEYKIIFGHPINFLLAPLISPLSHSPVRKKRNARCRCSKLPASSSILQFLKGKTHQCLQPLFSVHRYFTQCISQPRTRSGFEKSKRLSHYYDCFCLCAALMCAIGDDPQHQLYVVT